MLILVAVTLLIVGTILDGTLIVKLLDCVPYEVPLDEKVSTVTEAFADVAFGISSHQFYGIV